MQTNAPWVNIITAQISCCSHCVACIIIPNAHIASEERSDSHTSLFWGGAAELSWSDCIKWTVFYTYDGKSRDDTKWRVYDRAASPVPPLWTWMLSYEAPRTKIWGGLIWRQAEEPFMSSRNVPGMAIKFSSSGGEQARLCSKYTARGNIID